jgi:hypothetical protein
VKHELVHGPGITKAYFDLRRVHVYVDTRRLELQVQDVRGVALVVQHILVCLPYGVREQAVANVAPVHEDVLGVARGSGVLGRPDEAVQPDRACALIDDERGRVERVAEQCRDPLTWLLKFEVPACARIVVQGERRIASRQRNAPEGFVAMRVFGALGLEELAARRGIEIEIAHFHGRAHRQRRRRGCRERRTFRGD